MWKYAWRSLIDLFYPRLCLICETNLSNDPLMVCPACRLGLPLTHFHDQPDNPFEERFWGRFSFESGTALLFFRKGGMVQELMHQFKYGNQPDIGRELGRMQGYALRKTERFEAVEAVVPVPLHPRKERVRGYNQSAHFGKGIAEVLDVPLLKKVLVRRVHTPSQTRKSRFERLENMREAFEVSKPEILKGKHLLLVDDVLTTGATLEACALQLLEVPGVKVHLATMALADY